MTSDRALESALCEMVVLMRGAKSETTRLQAAQALLSFASRTMSQEELERVADGVVEALGDVLREGSRK